MSSSAVVSTKKIQFPKHLIYKSKQSDDDIYFEKYRKKSGKERKKMNRYPIWDKQIKMINILDRQRQIFCETKEYNPLTALTARNTFISFKEAKEAKEAK